MLEVFKYPIYRVLWVSILIGTIGYSFEYIAATGIINHIYDEDIAISYYLGIGSAVPFLLTYVTAVIIDKYDQRWIRLIASILGTTTAIGYIYSYKYKSIWGLYLTTFAVSVYQSFTWPAMAAYTSKVIPKDQLINANTIDMMTYKLLGIAFQGLGGFLTLWFSLIEIYIGVLIIYVIADLILSSLIWYPNFNRTYKESKGTKEMEKNKDKSQMTLFKEGWIYLKKRKSITHLIAMRVMMNVATGMTFPLIYYYSFNVYTLKDSGPFTMGIFMATEGILSLIFAALANKFCKNDIKKMLTMIIISSFFVVVGVGLFVKPLNIYMAIGGYILLMAGVMVAYIMMTTVIQKQVPDGVQGRVLSIGFIFRQFAWGGSTIVIGYMLTYRPNYTIWYIIGVGGLMILMFIYTIYIRLTFEIIDKDETEEEQEGLLIN